MVLTLELFRSADSNVDINAMSTLDDDVLVGTGPPVSRAAHGPGMLVEGPDVAVQSPDAAVRGPVVVLLESLMFCPVTPVSRPVQGPGMLVEGPGMVVEGPAAAVKGPVVVLPESLKTVAMVV